MFKKILIVNRGEIAVRIIRACKELGITSAVIYSEADKTSLHTRYADESYLIGPPPSSESYLNKGKIIKLAKEIKADAIHPGYGFLAENDEFIKMLEDEKITFIGPSSNSVKMMGSKTAARELMQKNKVPIVPGTTKPVKSVEDGLKIANEIGYPVLLKASAGGGGKGMKKVFNNNEFKPALESARREALKSFSNNDIYIEKLIENPRHIEVQIIGDHSGNIVHLFERECSIQRRHQKIIEEAPSSFVDEKTREKIMGAAIQAAKACGYYNAGTIEFLMDSDKNFYFLEMNTRLQVEHPVTEMITGIDLVKKQISVAAGNKLSFTQNELKINGHSFECRIYAEDPVNNFMPSTGNIQEYKEPAGPGIRVDSGFDRSSQISIYYDPLIAKLVSHANDRKSAINRMKRGLDEFRLSGLLNNIHFLKRIFEDKNFVIGKFDINFLEKDFEFNDIKNQDGRKNLTDEDVAIIFSALTKSFSSVNGNNQNKAVSSNNWQSLKYE